MTEYIKVTVQPIEPNVINVASSQTTPNLKVTIDPTEQNAKLSRDWAIGEGLIQNEDYSSKTWAGESKSSADLSKMYSEAASLDLTNLENKIIEYDEQLNTTITDGLDNINTSVTSGVETIETLQANSLAEITTNKESALSDITTASNLGLDNIATAETNALNNIDTDLTNATNEINTNRANTLAQISTLANTSISDINAVGKSYDNLTYRNITNCLLEVPQCIKLELSDGVLTLKAGSEVIVPNGFEADGVTPKFDYVTVESDVSLTSSTTAGTRLGFCIIGTDTDTLVGCVNTYMYSGDTAKMNSTSAVTYGRFYNTQTNKIYLCNSNGGSWVETTGTSLPICIFTNDANGVVTSLDQVFNGMGYIGSTAWVDKGVKGLIPNGRNEDGTLNNIEVVQEKLSLFSAFSGTYNRSFWIYGNGELGTGVYYYEQATPPTVDTTKVERYFNTTDNFIYYHAKDETHWTRLDEVNNGNFCLVGTLQSTDDVITSFTPKQPFRAIDYSELANKLEATISKASTGSIQFNNGFIVNWGRIQINAGSSATVTFKTPFTSTNYKVVVTIYATDAGSQKNVSANNYTTTNCKIYNGQGGQSNYDWIAIGY